MKSRAHFKGHPLHAMLIAFPLAFLVGSAVADLVGQAGDWAGMWTVGGYLSIAGVVMGLVAAVPGFVDYVAVVPPNSSARKRATQHMLINVSALVLFAIGWTLRDWETMRPGWAVVVLEWIGVGLVSTGGWMGGTLVYRNQIGVDHRFAHAGKWREERVEGAAGEPVVVEGAEQMKAGQMWLVHWSDQRIVLARTEEGFVAFEDRCSHRGGPLSDGALICGTVQCPWHGSQFDCRTGAVKAGPAEQPIQIYRAELREGKVHVILPVQAQGDPEKDRGGIS